MDWQNTIHPGISSICWRGFFAMGSPQRWWNETENFKKLILTFRCFSSSHPSTIHQHNVARYCWTFNALWALSSNCRCSKWVNRLTLAETVGWTPPVCFVWTASKTLSTEDTGLWTIEIINWDNFPLGTRWAQVWEVDIVIVETLKHGKSTHTAPLMFWALRSCFVLH